MAENVKCSVVYSGENENIKLIILISELNHLKGYGCIGVD